MQVTKCRKPRTKAGKTNKKLEKSTDENDHRCDNYRSGTLFNNLLLDVSANLGNCLKTSDSDFSDTEAGNAAKLTLTAGRVRQSALNLFLNVAQVFKIKE